MSSLTGTWVDIATIQTQTKIKDNLEQRNHQKFDFKGIELDEKDQFKVGSKIFEISFCLDNSN